jgi:hypothetical protein
VHSLLPLYLATVLGASAATIGIVSWDLRLDIATCCISKDAFGHLSERGEFRGWGNFAQPAGRIPTGIQSRHGVADLCCAIRSLTATSVKPVRSLC